MIRKGCPDEYPIALVVNGYEMAIFQPTKYDLEDWTYGYLFSEGFIKDAEDIKKHSLHGRLRPGVYLFFYDRCEEEMLSKAAKFGFALIGSRTAATRQAQN